MVADAHQGLGLGSRLVDAVAQDVAAAEVDHVQAVVSTENHVVRGMIMRRVSDAHYELDGPLVTVTVDVGALGR